MEASHLNGVMAMNRPRILEKGNYDNGQAIAETGGLNAELTGLYRTFFHNGRECFWVEMVNGAFQGRSESFYLSGMIHCKANYFQDELNGPYELWWENGQLKEVGEYKMGKKSGLYSWFKLDGSLWNEQLVE